MATNDPQKLIAVLRDQSSSWQDRLDAATTIRHANEGLLVGADGIAHQVDLTSIPSEWRSPAVVEALVERASDPNEYAGVWGEAAEALAYIWTDAGTTEPEALQRLVPGAQEEVRSLIRNAEPG
jgi:hypothetical protein